MDVDDEHVQEQNILSEENGNADAEAVMVSEEVSWQDHHAQDFEGPEMGKYLILLFCSLFY